MLLKWSIRATTYDLCPPAPDQPQERLVPAAPAPTLYDWASRSTHLHRFVHKHVHQSVLGALIALWGLLWVPKSGGEAPDRLLGTGDLTRDEQKPPG